MKFFTSSIALAICLINGSIASAGSIDPLQNAKRISVMVAGDVSAQRPAAQRGSGSPEAPSANVVTELPIPPLRKVRIVYPGYNP